MNITELYVPLMSSLSLSLSLSLSFYLSLADVKCTLIRMQGDLNDYKSLAFTSANPYGNKALMSNFTQGLDKASFTTTARYHTCTSPVIVVLSYKHCEALLTSLVLVYMYTTLRTCTFNTGLLDTLFSLCYTYMYVLLLFCTMSCTCACRMVEKSLLLGIPSMTSGMASTRSKRILRELRHYQNDPHPSIEVYPNEDKYRLQLVHPQYM